MPISRVRWSTLALLLTLTSSSWISAAEYDFEDFGVGLFKAIGDFASEGGTTFTLCHAGVLIFKTGEEKLPEVNGILEDYAVWLTPRTQIIVYATPEWKKQVEAFIGEANRRGIPFKRAVKPGSDDLLFSFGPGGKQTDTVMSYCLKHAPILLPDP
jgi:hypothetical protein